MSLVSNAARYLTTSPLRTAAIGAGVGAAAGALNPQDGQSRMGGAVIGGLRGGAVGGLVGGTGRALRDTRLLHAAANPAAAPLGVGGTIAGAAQRFGQGVSNFGRRQVYGLTGHGNPNQIGMAGTATAGRKINLLEARAKDEIAHAPHAAEKIRSSADAQVQSVREQGLRDQGLADAGLQSIPGIAKGLVNSKTRSTALRAMGKSMVSGGATMGVGVPLAFAAPGLLRGDESRQGGDTLGEKVRSLGLNMGVGAATGALPFVPQMLAATAIDGGVRRLTAHPKRIPRSLLSNPGGAQ